MYAAATAERTRQPVVTLRPRQPLVVRPARPRTPPPLPPPTITTAEAALAAARALRAGAAVPAEGYAAGALRGGALDVSQRALAVSEADVRALLGGTAGRQPFRAGPPPIPGAAAAQTLAQAAAVSGADIAALLGGGGARVPTGAEAVRGTGAAQLARQAAEVRERAAAVTEATVRALLVGPAAVRRVRAPFPPGAAPAAAAAATERVAALADGALTAERERLRVLEARERGARDQRDAAAAAGDDVLRRVAEAVRGQAAVQAEITRANIGGLLYAADRLVAVGETDDAEAARTGREAADARARLVLAETRLQEARRAAQDAHERLAAQADPAAGAAPVSAEVLARLRERAERTTADEAAALAEAEAARDRAQQAAVAAVRARNVTPADAAVEVLGGLTLGAEQRRQVAARRVRDAAVADFEERAEMQEARARDPRVPANARQAARRAAERERRAIGVLGLDGATVGAAAETAARLLALLEREAERAERLSAEAGRRGDALQRRLEQQFAQREVDAERRVAEAEQRRDDAERRARQAEEALLAGQTATTAAAQRDPELRRQLAEAEERAVQLERQARTLTEQLQEAQREVRAAAERAERAVREADVAAAARIEAAQGVAERDVRQLQERAATAQARLDDVLAQLRQEQQLRGAATEDLRAAREAEAVSRVALAAAEGRVDEANALLEAERQRAAVAEGQLEAVTTELEAAVARLTQQGAAAQRQATAVAAAVELLEAQRTQFIGTLNARIAVLETQVAQQQRVAADDAARLQGRVLDVDQLQAQVAAGRERAASLQAEVAAMRTAAAQLRDTQQRDVQEAQTAMAAQREQVVREARETERLLRERIATLERDAGAARVQTTAAVRERDQARQVLEAERAQRAVVEGNAVEFQREAAEARSEAQAARAEAVDARREREGEATARADAERVVLRMRGELQVATDELARLRPLPAELETLRDQVMQAGEEAARLETARQTLATQMATERAEFVRQLAEAQLAEARVQELEAQLLQRDALIATNLGLLSEIRRAIRTMEANLAQAETRAQERGLHVGALHTALGLVGVRVIEEEERDRTTRVLTRVLLTTENVAPAVQRARAAMVDELRARVAGPRDDPEAAMRAATRAMTRAFDVEDTSVFLMRGVPLLPGWAEGPRLRLIQAALFQQRRALFAEAVRLLVDERRRPPADRDAEMRAAVERYQAAVTAIFLSRPYNVTEPAELGGSVAVPQPDTFFVAGPATVGASASLRPYELWTSDRILETAREGTAAKAAGGGMADRKTVTVPVAVTAERAVAMGAEFNRYLAPEGRPVAAAEGMASVALQAFLRQQYAPYIA